MKPLPPAMVWRNFLTGDHVTIGRRYTMGGRYLPDEFSGRTGVIQTIDPNGRDYLVDVSGDAVLKYSCDAVWLHARRLSLSSHPDQCSACGNRFTATPRHLTATCDDCTNELSSR